MKARVHAYCGDRLIRGGRRGHLFGMVCATVFVFSCSEERLVFGENLSLDGGSIQLSDAASMDSAVITAVTVSQPLKCVPGTYVGSMDGVYRSEPGGYCGVVAGVEEPALGQWSFALLSTGGSEFASVKAGCAHFSRAREVLEDGGTNFAHRAEIAGNVDCTTGVLSAVVRGTYLSVGKCDLGLVWTHYFYKGTMTGRFDLDSQSFVDTVYSIAERQPLLGAPAGGHGTWTGVLAEDAGAPSGMEEDCLGIDFPDDLAPIPESFGTP